jgi:Flp pilus assembly protein TadD
MRQFRIIARMGVCAIAAVLAAGCGAHRFASSSVPVDKRPQSRPAAPARTMAVTLEAMNPALSAALLKVAVFPSSADAHRDLAREYRRLGVMDMAHEHFTRAVTLDRTDAVSYEALARIWRDWGTPQLGLADAYRAVYFAPDSASAANTLGTVLHRLHRVDAAMDWYARAISLDPQASYALNNLCYAQVVTGAAAARETCRRAVAASPDANVAKNNLALAHTAAGDLHSAKDWFRRAADPAIASYNYGIAMMATRAYEQAQAAFHEAVQSKPSFALAATREKQAAMAARSEGDRP